jgi:hypothetical protein
MHQPFVFIAAIEPLKVGYCRRDAVRFCNAVEDLGESLSISSKIIPQKPSSFKQFGVRATSHKEAQKSQSKDKGNRRILFVTFVLLCGW